MNCGSKLNRFIQAETLLYAFVLITPLAALKADEPPPPPQIVPLGDSVLRGEAESEKSLLLHCGFDGALKAESAQEGGSGSAAIAPEYQEGIRGQALVIGGRPSGDQKTRTSRPIDAGGPGRNALYPAKNINVEKGTVSFWLLPLDWTGSDYGANVLFRTQVGDNYFMLYKVIGANKLLFLRGKTGMWTSVYHRIEHWKPGQWRHVAITWNPEEMRLFVDGRLVDAKKMRFPFKNTGEIDPVSVGPGGSWEKAYTGRSLVDEFRVHERPLTSGEITELYLRDAGAARMDRGQVTVGKRTPKLDGKIEASEYSFTGTGFSDLRGVLATVQSRYALSYDDKNLYIAVRSPLDPARAESPDERIEIFLPPASGAGEMRRVVAVPAGTLQASGFPKGSEPIAHEQTVANGEWTVEMSIPFSSMGIEGAPEEKSRLFNIARTFSHPQRITSVSPVVGRMDDHAQFLELRFRKDAPQVRLGAIFGNERGPFLQDISARTETPGTSLDLIRITDNTEDPAYGLRTSKRRLFADGRGTPLTVNRPADWAPKPNAFSIETVRVVESRDGKDETVFSNRYVLRDEQQPLRAIFLYTLDRQRLSVSCERREAGQIRARFLRPDGTTAWEAQQPIPADGSFFDSVFDLDFKKLTPGDYAARIEHVAADGKATGVYEVPYRVPGKDHPAFHKYTDPEADKVPAPWTPLVSDGPRVSMWGRTYDFSQGFLVSSLLSQGNELLARPAVLRLDGKALEPVAPPTVKPVAASDMEVTWQKAADLGPIQVESKVRTFFDGYCEIAMTLLPGRAGPPQIRTLSLDLPLRGEIARMVRDGKISSMAGSKSGALGNPWSQKLVDAPFLWLGNDHAGFNWLAPSLENWHVKNHNLNVEILREGDVAILRFNLVDTPLRLDKPRTITFGFVLTPSKPLDPNIQRGRFMKEWQMWCQPWQVFGTPDYDTAKREEIKRCGEGVDEVFLYLGQNFIGPFSPDQAFFQEEWLALRPARTYGEYTGPSNLRQYCYTEGCLGSETMLNSFGNRYAEFFRKAKTPLTPKAVNYYFDTGVGVSPCMNPKHPECKPWKDLNRQEWGRMKIAIEREVWLNSYRMIRRTGPTAKICLHMGWTRCIPLQHFSDIIVGGEAWETLIKQNGGTYYDLFTPELFRATFGSHIWGCRMAHLDMLVRLLREDSPAKLLKFRIDDPVCRQPLLHSYGYCVLHDVDIGDSYAESRPLRNAIWAAQDSLGWNADVRFHSYWEPGPVKRTQPANDRVMASAYSKNGNVLLAVLNDTPNEQKVRLDLDLAALGATAGKKGFDAFAPSRTHTLGPVWEETLPPRAFRLIVWSDKASLTSWPDSTKPWTEPPPSTQLRKAVSGGSP